jgi:hypothetical protein
MQAFKARKGVIEAVGLEKGRQVMILQTTLASLLKLPLQEGSDVG